ncbi:MAG: hypothetical protein Q4B28_07150 [bacterium]|nr:hypothetical protein [bacterium]
MSRVSLAPETYTKASLLIPYSNEIFDYSFDETVEKIQTFLDAFLPRRAASQVGYFKTYIGVKYKLTFSYEEEKSRIHIGWIVKRAEKAQIMRVILAFIEGLKKTPSLSQEEKRIES